MAAKSKTLFTLPRFDLTGSTIFANNYLFQVSFVGPPYRLGAGGCGYYSAKQQRVLEQQYIIQIH